MLSEGNWLRARRITATASMVNSGPPPWNKKMSDSVMTIVIVYVMGAGNEKCDDKGRVVTSKGIYIKYQVLLRIAIVIVGAVAGARI